MLSEKNAKKVLLHILLPLLIAVISCTVLAKAVPESKFVQSTLESIEDSKTTVLEFTGATLAASLAISALPDDFATPIADNFAGMSKYFLVILMALFVERLILVVGVKMSFLFIIPAACALLAAGLVTKKEFLIVFAKKTAILAITLIMVVPCSVKFTNYVGADYLAYVNETIEETNGGANKINDEMTNETEGATIFEKLSDAFKTAIKGVSDLLSYFNDMIKKCMTSIAILLVTDFVMPIATLFIFRWLLKEIFGIVVPTKWERNWIQKREQKREKDISLIEERKE